MDYSTTTTTDKSSDSETGIQPKLRLQLPSQLKTMYETYGNLYHDLSSDDVQKENQKTQKEDTSNKENEIVMTLDMDVLPKTPLDSKASQLPNQQLKQKVKSILKRKGKSKDKKKSRCWKEKSLFSKHTTYHSIVRSLTPCYYQGVYNLMYSDRLLDPHNIEKYRQLRSTVKFRKYQRGDFVYETKN